LQKKWDIVRAKLSPRGVRGEGQRGEGGGKNVIKKK